MIKKITVFFTDIIGSTDFFKSYGDVAGRQMLQKHERIVAGTIIEYGGTVVKNIGDSVMAYFLDPWETVKSAVRIQQKFSKYNRGAPPENQIHVRIGIHNGDAIIEDDDIFGDVVNVASKLTSLAHGDQILVSEEVCRSMKEPKDISFNVIDLSDRRGTPKGLKAFDVGWSDGAVFEPVTAIALCVRPLWELGISDLEPIWNRLLDGRGILWRGKSEQEKILQDRSVILIAKRPDDAFEISHKLFLYIRDGLSGGDVTLQVVPVQVVIDAGPYLGTDTLNLESFGVCWEAVTPGSILISHRAYSMIDKGNAPAPSQASGHDKPFFEMRIDDWEQNDHSLLFLYQNAFLRGGHVPCFYCGSTVHDVSHCPSKNITEMTHGITRAGYLSFDMLNSLFLAYVSKKGHEVDGVLKRRDHMDKDGLIPHCAFYDVKKYFQLRFFKHIWDTKVPEWNKIARATVGEGGKGGFVWLAQDCIRVSNLTQAESLLKTCLEKYPGDYKVYCALGFLNLERKKILSAEYYFTRALSHAKLKTQKIYILLLLCRLFYISDNMEKASDAIREIKYADP
ncbi:MAG: adenylate/guanylate cyclase domain-containing protein, partial [Deltaproteobacteria bacterium]|nr:adenylate/guanylate cyclase domain-containing protein [Deltaproteobacteria bacterium]